MTRPTNGRRRRRALGGLAGGALAVLAALIAFAASGTAAPAAAPKNETKPQISDTSPREGETLTAFHGSWTGNPTDYKYQWRRCNKDGFNCLNIPEATDRLYTVRSTDVDHPLRVAVTAINADGSNTALSDATDPVAQAVSQSPTTSTVPQISGTPKEGETLTAQPNTWRGTQPITLSYRWRRCVSDGGNCDDTPVTTQTYKLASADVGHTLRVVVTARNSAGEGAAISDPTAVIQAASTTPPPPPPSGGCASVSTVSLNTPELLLVDRIQSTPDRIHSRDEPLVVRFHVTTTKGRCISGALVYAVGVPFDRLSQGQEVTTGGDGWASVTFRIQPTFPLRPGNLVVIFVRARKPGDSLLAGVSSRRLVSIRVG